MSERAGKSASQAVVSMNMSSLLIVDDDPGIRSHLQRGLQKHFALVETAEDANSADVLQQRCLFDLIIADIRLPDCSSVEWITGLREHGNTSGVIFLSSRHDMETAIAALRAGAEDFIMKPFRLEQMLAAVDRYLQRRRIQREHCVPDRRAAHWLQQTVGEGPLIQELYQVIRRVAPMPSTVLIEGESGTGKELAARAIHDWSGRSGSFVPVNCGAMSAELLESELFGHIKGAFTGAHQAREGLFAFADGGTLFLDEIGEMPMAMQAHLLRVLEERTVRPVGSNQHQAVDVRIVAATNRDLQAQVRKGVFREDLYYRLNVLSLRMPSLRERPEDLAVLARHFYAGLAAELGIASPRLPESELELLQHYPWPGNVRELKNLIERCLLLNKLPGQCLGLHSGAVAAQAAAQPLPVALEDVEKQHIIRVLGEHNGNKSAAARVLGVSRKTLERKLQTWGQTRH